MAGGVTLAAQLQAFEHAATVSTDASTLATEAGDIDAELRQTASALQRALGD